MTLRMNRSHRTHRGHIDSGLVSRNAIPQGARGTKSDDGRLVFQAGNVTFEETMPHTGIFRKLVHDPGKRHPL